jgi:alpha-L-fucosidase
LGDILDELRGLARRRMGHNMVTRRQLIGRTAAGAIAAGVWPRLPATLATQRTSHGQPTGVGPLIPADEKALTRFTGLRYGAMLSWGPATVLGKEFSWTREVDVPAAEYDALYKQFDPAEFDADAWVGMLKASGFRYLTLITKHHDGFAMWDTTTTDHSIMHTPFGRDVVKEVSAACKTHDLAFCLYYSIADFYQPDCIGANHANGMYLGPKGYALPAGVTPDFDRYVTYMKKQLAELSRNYGPIAAWWFDGGWMREWTYERGVDLLRYMRMLQPDTLADQRVGCAYNGRVYMPTWFPTDHDYVGDFAVLEVDMPRFNRDIPWEYTTPANGRSYCWTPGTYLDPHIWIDNLVKSACGDGNYLLGVSPPSTGRFDPALVDKLAESSLWIEKYGASIFETRGGPYKRTTLYGATCKGTRLYLHVFDRTLTELTLPALPAKVVRCSMLNGGKATFAQAKDGLTISINPNDTEAPSTIVELELDRSAEAIAPIGEVPVNRGVKTRSSNADPSTDRFACDGDIRSAWRADAGTKQPWIEFDLGSDKTLSRAILFEGAYEGELANIHRYQVDVRSTEADAWKRIDDVKTWGFDTSEEEDFFEWPISVFKPELRFTPTTARYVRVKVLKAVAPPVIHAFELYER